MISFDIFDTLITRKTSTPRGVFLAVQKKLEQMERYSDIAFQFAELRYESEQNARKFYPYREVDMQDIYDVLADRCNLKEDEIDELIRLEIETETELVFPIRKNIDLLKEKIAAGDRVVLISDMYLNVDTIRKLLLKADPIFGDINIYVSCDCGVKKSDGQLYKFVQEREAVDYGNWVHYGDNIVTDYNVPRLYGIQAIRTVTYLSSEIEKKLSEYFHAEENYGIQVYLGMIRELCIDNENFAYKFGAMCCGGVLFPYVNWIVSRARELSLSKLLFMSRDGYLLKKLAERIIQEQNIPLETEYIYVSKDVLRDNGDIGSRALNYIMQYVKNDENVAFIDFQGTGASLACLSEKLQMDIHGFYYILNGKLNQGKAHLHCYRYVPIKSGMIEIMCRAPHGAVIDYREEKGILEPVFSDAEIGSESNHRFMDYISGVIDFAELYADYPLVKLSLHDLDSIGGFLIKYIENTPDMDTVSYIGEFPHSEHNQGESYGYAPMLSDADIDTIYGKRGEEALERYYKGSNIEYSFKRVGKDLRQHIGNSIKDGVVTFKSENAERIIIYAAGKYGYEAWYRITKSNNKVVVAWVDINYQSIDNPLVESPEVIKGKRYDTILVCLYNRSQYECVRRMFIDIGVPDEKIKWICSYWDGFFL